jgi:hypothetical protein
MSDNGTKLHGNLISHLRGGGKVKVILPNGNAGVVYVDEPYPGADPSWGGGLHYTFECREGFGAGVTEPICHVDSDYLAERFLAGATVERVN